MRFLRSLLPIGCALALSVSLPSPATAGWDDFEFGQKLIEKGYFDYAERVFQSILDDGSRTQADKDKARFGMALLGKAKLGRVLYDERVPYADVKAKYSDAIQQIRAFLDKYPSDPKADDAKSEMASLHLTFTQWGSDLAKNESEEEGPCGSGPSSDKEKKARPCDIRKTTPNEVLADIQNSVRHAEEIFSALKQTAKSQGMKDIAAYSFVVCKYYRALTFPSCSQQAGEALKDAAIQLDDYATTNEQYTAGYYAMDYLGLTKQEQAECEGNDDAAKRLYDGAFQAFQACADTPDQGDDSRRVICRGFFHLGRLANSLKERPWTRDVQRLARKSLQNMERSAPRAVKMEDGIKAMIEWGLLEGTLGDPTAAIGILKKASDHAIEEQFVGVQRRANSMIRCVLDRAGSSEFEADPGIIQRVAEDMYQNKEFAEAIRVYRQVIVAAPQTRDGLVKYVLPSWNRIGACYRSMEPPLYLEAALAFDAVVDEVRAGRIEAKSESDPIARLAKECYDAERGALNELVKATGDATVRDRLNTLTQEGPKLFQMGGSSLDQLYGVGQQFFKQAKDEQDQKSPSFPGTFQRARDSFLEVSKNAESDYQDSALQYLVRIPIELEQWSEAVSQADKALAYWDTAEAKKREKDDAFLGRRRVQKGWVGYWKALALREQKRDAEVLALCESFEKTFPGAAPDTVGRITGMHVDVLVDQGKIDEAESVLERLERDYPDYYGLGGILKKLASYYQVKVKALADQIQAATELLAGPPDDRTKGLRMQIVEAVKRENQLQERVTDLRATLDRARAEKAAADSMTDKDKADETRAAAEKAIADLEPKLKEAEKLLAEARQKREALQKQADDTLARREALEQEQAAPLRKAADLYRRLDDIVKGLDEKEKGAKQRRQADFVYDVATRYYALAKVQKTVVEDWKTVRSLFEDYLAFPDVKAAPDTEAKKRSAFYALGTALVRLAEAAASEEEARPLYATAVRYLESGLARMAKNTPIVVSHLAGETVTLPWQSGGVTWRIPVPRVASEAQFREYVDKLTPDRIPVYTADKTSAAYWKAVDEFKKHVKGLSDKELESTVKSLKDGGLDATFFGEHAWVSSDFLLTLAHAYLLSGVEDNAVRAMNSAKAVLRAAKVDEDTAEWWESHTILLEVSVSVAERKVKSGGDKSPEARSAAKEADAAMTTIKRLYPNIGGAERRALTLKEWKAIQLRLRAVGQALGLQLGMIDLEAAAPAPPPVAPPSPPSPTGPGMDGAPAMDH